MLPDDACAVAQEPAVLRVFLDGRLEGSARDGKVAAGRKDAHQRPSIPLLHEIRKATTELPEVGMGYGVEEVGEAAGGRRELIPELRAGRSEFGEEVGSAGVIGH